MMTRTKALLYTLIGSLFLLSGGFSSGQDKALSLNLADALRAGTIGLGGELALDRHFTAEASLRLNPWSFRSTDTFNGLYEEEDSRRILDKKQVYALGGKYWFWNVFSGWWTGGKILYCEYSHGGFSSPKTEEGDAAALSLSAGYSLMVRKHLNLDFGLGLWTGRKWYTVYSCPHCGSVEDEGKKFYVLPEEVVLSLVYVF